MLSRAWVWIWIPILFTWGCTSAPKYLGPDRITATAAQEAACIRFTGRGKAGFGGSIALSLKNADSQGQASADVLFTPPQNLRIEGHDPFGATLATLAIDGDRYEIDTRKLKGGMRETGMGSWSGIPVAWIRGLFVGVLPCPVASGGQVLQAELTSSGEWIARLTGGKRPEEVFRYSFSLGRDGRPWVARLAWARLGDSPLEAELEVPEWDESGLYPRRWEVKSPRAEVKVRWKNRALAN